MSKCSYNHLEFTNAEMTIAEGVKQGFGERLSFVYPGMKDIPPHISSETKIIEGEERETGWSYFRNSRFTGN